MYAFLSTLKPRSVRGDKNQAYQAGLRRAFANEYPNDPLLEGDLYSAVYYFHRLKTDLDADNLSKPVLDSLIGSVYEDDRQVKVRFSGVFDYGKVPYGVLDLGRVPRPAFQQLLGLINANHPHILYVEVGRLHYEHFRFGSEIAS